MFSPTVRLNQNGNAGGGASGAKDQAQAVPEVKYDNNPLSQLNHPSTSSPSTVSPAPESPRTPESRTSSSQRSPAEAATAVASSALGALRKTIADPTVDFKFSATFLSVSAVQAVVNSGSIFSSLAAAYACWVGGELAAASLQRQAHFQNSPASTDDDERQSVEPGDKSWVSALYDSTAKSRGFWIFSATAIMAAHDGLSFGAVFFVAAVTLATYNRFKFAMRRNSETPSEIPQETAPQSPRPATTVQLAGRANRLGSFVSGFFQSVLMNPALYFGPGNSLHRLSDGSPLLQSSSVHELFNLGMQVCILGTLVTGLWDAGRDAWRGQLKPPTGNAFRWHASGQIFFCLYVATSPSLAYPIIGAIPWAIYSATGFFQAKDSDQLRKRADKAVDAPGG